MSTADFDNLAANGIINFDADAYIKGTSPRYVGNPGNANAMPFEQPLVPPGSYYPGLGAQLPQQPGHDQFKHDEGHKKAGAKDVLAFAVFGSIAAYAGVKFKDQIKKLYYKVRPSKAPAVAVTPPPVTPPKVKGKGILGWLKNSRTAKITAGFAIVLLGLYGAYDFITKRKANLGVEAEEQAKEKVQAQVPPTHHYFEKQKSGE